MADRLNQKLARQAAAPSAGESPGGNEPAINENVETKIAEYRAKNPKHVEYIKGLSRERLENIATLRDIERQEQRHRIQQATGQKLEKWLETRPDEAKRITEAVAKLPPEDQARARIRMIQYAVNNEAFRNAPAVGGPKV